MGLIPFYNSYQPNQKSDVKFTAVYGELPKELNHLENGFSTFIKEFMKDKPGYDVYLSTTRNNKNLKMSGNMGLLNTSKNRKPISEIQSSEDLGAMLADNYLGIRAGSDLLEQLARIFQLV